MTNLQTEIQNRLTEHFSGAEIMVSDMSGTGDKWQISVVSDDFEGKSTIDRHRSIYDLFQSELEGKIHAMSLITLTRKQAL